MNNYLNKSLADCMKTLGEDHQDMLMMMFKDGVVLPDDTVEQALIKIDDSGDEYYEGIMDHLMHGIASGSESTPNVTVITNDEEAPHGPRGSLGKFGFLVNEEITPAPSSTGISLQELMDSADEEDATEIGWLVTKHFMKPSADVTELVIKLNTLLNPKMGGLPGGVEDITATEINFDEMANTPVGNLMPHEQHEHNKRMRSMYGLKLIEKVLGKHQNPKQHKFLNFLDGLKGSHDDDLISIIENGFKLIHKKDKSN